jgi:hypothetical protein
VTLRRIRAYSTIIAVVLWTMWGIVMSTPGPRDRFGKVKGTDFLEFYVAGSFAREGRLQDFYDVPTQYARAQSIAPGADDTLYLPVHSPSIALVFAPLSAIAYPSAVLVWAIIVIGLYAAAVALVWRQCDGLRSYRRETIVAMASFPGLYATVLHGQTSVIALLAVGAAFAALRNGRPVAAGLALGCLAFKPHWMAAVAAVFVIALEWRVVLAMGVSAAAQFGAAAAIVGSRAMRAYAGMMMSIPRIDNLLEPHPGDSLRAFFRVFVPVESIALGLYVAASLAVIIVTARLWRSGAAFELRASAILVATILISPHAFAYDLVLLAPAFLLLANWMAAQGGAPSRQLHLQVVWSLCALFMAPLLAAIPAVLRLQFSVTAMAVLLAALQQASRLQTDATPAASSVRLRPAVH